MATFELFVLTNYVSKSPPQNQNPVRNSASYACRNVLDSLCEPHKKIAQPTPYRTVCVSETLVSKEILLEWEIIIMHS